MKRSLPHRPCRILLEREQRVLGCASGLELGRGTQRKLLAEWLVLTEHKSPGKGGTLQRPEHLTLSYPAEKRAACSDSGRCLGSARAKSRKGWKGRKGEERARGWCSRDLLSLDFILQPVVSLQNIQLWYDQISNLPLRVRKTLWSMHWGPEGQAMGRAGVGTGWHWQLRQEGLQERNPPPPPKVQVKYRRLLVWYRSKESDSFPFLFKVMILYKGHPQI